MEDKITRTGVATYFVGGTINNAIGYLIIVVGLALIITGVVMKRRMM